MKLASVLTEIRQVLKDSVDPKVLYSDKKYFKEEIKMYGVRVLEVTRLSKMFYESFKNESKEDIFELCEELWKSDYSEECYMACNFSYYICDRYEPADFKVFDYWVKTYVNNWATCDTLCNHSVGTFVEMYPQFVNEVKQWATSSNRWVKRAAAVTFIIPARKGLFHDDIFEIADTLLMDKDDMVQKGYGWMLKATSEADRERVFRYVLSKKAVMPRTSLRYAIEKMPQEMRAEAMKK